jgi:hypothetical protein
MANGNYLNRKACEAVAGHVLLDDEHRQAYLKVTKDDFYNPQTDEINAAAALNPYSGKLRTMTQYIAGMPRSRASWLSSPGNIFAQQGAAGIFLLPHSPTPNFPCL